MNLCPSPLDRFIPQPDVRERFEISIRAPAGLVMEIASNFDMQSLPLVRAIFWLREKVLASDGHGPRRPQGLLDEMQALGWGRLAEQRDRLVVCGARCQPWLANVTFTALSADDFKAYAEPGQVKIAWTLETEERAPALTRFVQETRAAATDETSKTRFLRYWRWARFGIVAIRLLLLPAIRRTAEQRWAVERGRA
ncbi:MAG TPA: hypothetical protein PLW72_08665 [Burkholderiaceae bacterium]|nr:hypothetical protein [Burkholderiaceae bacterium]